MHIPIWFAYILINRRRRHFTAGNGAAITLLRCLPVPFTQAPPSQAIASAMSVPSKPWLFVVVGNAREESSRLMKCELQDFGSYNCASSHVLQPKGVLAPTGRCTGVASTPRPPYVISLWRLRPAPVLLLGAHPSVSPLALLARHVCLCALDPQGRFH